jgi:hypothetical protein
MKDHGVDVVLDKDAVAYGPDSLDSTGEVIEKLDAVLSAVPVTLADGPASGQAR